MRVFPEPEGQPQDAFTCSPTQHTTIYYIVGTRELLVCYWQLGPLLGYVLEYSYCYKLKLTCTILCYVV